MRAIVAVDENWAIGREGGMLYDLPGDLRHFAWMTRGKVLVMGRGTLNSLPGGKPLKDRVNLVMSRDPGLSVPGAQVLQSMAELESAIAEYPPEDVMLMGGETLYTQLLAHCDRAFVTRIQARAPGADRFFPNLDLLPAWRLVSCEPQPAENGLRYSFCEYENQSVRGF